MGKSKTKENLAIIRSRTYKKSNELINSKGSSSNLCQKLFAVGMFHMEIDETNNVIATISTTELQALFGTTSGSLYTHIEEACDRSFKGQTLFDWQILKKDPEKKILVASQVVTDAAFKDGTLIIRYNNSLTNMIVDLKNDYTILSLSEILAMKSVHSLRLYEILKSCYDKEVYMSKDAGKHAFHFSLVELKLLLGIIPPSSDKRIQKELAKEYPNYTLVEEILNKNGENKYPEYKHFNNEVIKKALKEINSKTSIHVETDRTKTGRNTTGLWFFVEKKENQKIETSEKPLMSQQEMDSILDSLYEMMHSVFKVSEVRELCNMANYDKEKIIDAYEYMEEYNGKDIDVPIAFMKAAIKEGYKKPDKKIKKFNNNRFNNFPQNEYDFGELEKQLLDN
ncbi:replication initiation protein [Butyrivibrio proteoclasticus]|uniref:replication initiation protein n=1 Tax=Butyrivibrio proteoclasticus TaxID=43305 RepID=UPI00047976F8|nr:replication initiation protein [Butyrivibrio proteoclasticus]